MLFIYIPSESQRRGELCKLFSNIILTCTVHCILALELHILIIYIYDIYLTDDSMKGFCDLMTCMQIYDIYLTDDSMKGFCDLMTCMQI